MDDYLTKFIRSKRIDSYQKLRLLLFFYQRPNIRQSAQELAQEMHLGNTIVLQKAITDLQGAGLIDRIEDRFTLRDEPDIRKTVRSLSLAFDDPLSRQKILDYIRQPAPPSFTPVSYPLFI